MDKKFKLIAVDDKPESLEPILAAVKELLSLDGLNLDYQILSKEKDVNKLKEFPCDIVMFDCALSGENFDFSDYEEARFGFKLLQDYRKQNRRTKIIFYSGSFDFEDEGNFDLSCLDFVQMINELNVFAISNRDVRRLACLIQKAIAELDTVLVSMEDLILTYGENGTFIINGAHIPAQQLLTELRLGTEIGEKFREDIYSTIISYFMKFGGVQE